MQYKFITDTGSDRLILIFAGWGMSADTFGGVSRPGYDVLVVWDYRSFYIDWSITDSYKEICLVAWSMGVYAASQTVHAIDYKITRRIAVNGTLHPIDDLAGIPEKIFSGTLEGLSEASVRKFMRRMCATREDFEEFSYKYTPRPVAELAEELRAIADRMVLPVPPAGTWDLAIIGKEDRIFAPVNQRRAWLQAPFAPETPVSVEVVDAGHWLDFATLIDRYVIDKSTMQKRFEAGTATYAAHSPVQAEVVDRLAAAIRNLHLSNELSRTTAPILEIGSGAGYLSAKIAAMAPNAPLTMCDIAAEAPGEVKGRFVRDDAELFMRRCSDESFGYIFSASTVQWFNSPARFMKECARVLMPGGYAFITTFVSGNLQEISSLTGASLPLMSTERWRQLLAADFEVVWSSEYVRDLDFESPLEVLRHLKNTGVNSLGSTSHGEVDVRRLMAQYPMRLDARYHLTYKPLILILKKL